MSDKSPSSLCQTCGINFALHDEEHCKALQAQELLDVSGRDLEPKKQDTYPLQCLLAS